MEDANADVIAPKPTRPPPDATVEDTARQEEERQARLELENAEKQRQDDEWAIDTEKEMNKDDLNAWKKYDDNQYSMIPGITAAKRFAEPKPAKFSSPPNRSGKAALHNEDKVRIHEERLV